MSVCSVCAKTFKNLRLHTVKMHEDIEVRRSRDPDTVFESVKYGGSILEDWGDYQGTTNGTIVYGFPVGHILHGHPKFDGIGISYNDIGVVTDAFYIRYERLRGGEWGGWHDVGQISMERVRTYL